MTYHIYYSIFLKKLHLYFYLLFTQNVVVELLSAYFAFVEDDHSSTLAAVISLL